MRHKIGYKKLNRTSEHRKALIKNMLGSLIKYEQINTTLPKAKVLRPVAEKIITLGKKDTLHNTKTIISKLQNKELAKKVRNTLSKRYKDRKGGYTRIIKAGYRSGDNAPVAIIEFVDRDLNAKKVDKKEKSLPKDKDLKEKKEDNPQEDEIIEIKKIINQQIPNISKISTSEKGNPNFCEFRATQIYVLGGDRQ